MPKPKKPKMPKVNTSDCAKVNTSDCAKGQMHEPAAQRYLKTMPGGFIA